MTALISKSSISMEDRGRGTKEEDEEEDDSPSG
eukprot:CAMPEP_0201518308 /NCGR_PEP_ID=MMETSP0161_2-20130828/9187_1 /ASSEMBLY_ACC=CAM_ASM_000251 /TAXON_ID=180227 /ORGANISM="Neoparamoeba aestuarina, Strain SoJaBio B1-5/56/2" /LENGTH=32 /DNA_ID= /DNA_START= /DNA_END= /DNA_ORIENTATION=